MEAPWLRGAELLHERGETRDSAKWLARGLDDLDAWSVLRAVELARDLGLSESALLTLRRLPLPRSDARVVAAAFLVGDAAGARESLGGSLTALSIAVGALARAGLKAEVEVLLTGQPAFERARALAQLTRWVEAAAAVQQIDQPQLRALRAWAWLVLADLRRRSDPREAVEWMHQAELSALALHEDDRRELLVEGWALLGECGRALDLAVGGPPRLLFLVVDACSEPSQLDLLEQVRGDLDAALRDEFTAHLVETAVRHGQRERATHLATTLRPPSLVPALIALALGEGGVDAALFPFCAVSPGQLGR